ncbi:hypothetical protein MKQ68_20600 [Chitinophaga horti]|uniref:Uncharacterized protein n=1 Tax=Chitinophaga horti TaxID=2920382 RepID=A0ABY6IYM4_9BACT|nr:hypothetical protein [Chitinophaga horti]UYQ92487.1 hypothetical protein MKQ68_20600 [Chitinophaga horti]
MAVSTNLLLMALSGSIGDLMTIKNYGNKVVMCKKVKKREKKATPKQEANQLNFKEASGVVKLRYADLEQREAARLRLKLPYGISLFRAMLSEYYKEMENGGE